MAKTAKTLKFAKASKAGIAEIQLINNGAQPEIKVLVPRGTSLTDTLRLKPQISELVGKLTGCTSCNSGIPILFHEFDMVQHVVRVDLDKFSKMPQAY